MQASVLDGFAFDPFSFQQDGLTASEVDVGRRQIVDALVVAQVIVVGDEGFDPSLELAGQIVVLQQDAVLERQMPALDLPLLSSDDRARRGYAACLVCRAMPPTPPRRSSACSRIADEADVSR